MKPAMRAPRKFQRGIAALEFAILFPLLITFLLLVLTGVMMYAVKQSVTEAASEGARAALRYGSATQRKNVAELTAANAMQWLVGFAGAENAYATAQLLAPGAPECNAGTYCYKVQVTYNWAARPLMPTGWIPDSWAPVSLISDTAIVQLDAASSTQVATP